MLYQGTLTDFSYEKLRILGEGSFGKVYKCRVVGTDRNVAIKEPKDHGPTDVAELTFLRRILRMGFDPDEVRIVRFLDLVWNMTEPCIVLEYLGQSLEESFSGEELHVSHVRSIGLQLLKALECLKSIGVVHGDIKPSNILVAGFSGEAMGIKLADLGGFEVNDSNPPRVHEALTTLPYRSPEVLVGLTASFPIDVWAVALVLVECYAGCRLFPAHTEMGMMDYIVSLLGTDECFLQGKFASQFFTQHLTLKDHNEPVEPTFLDLISLLQVVNHASNSEQIDAWYFLCFVEKALALNPSERITPEEAFHHDFFTLGHLTDQHREYRAEIMQRIFPC